jgi:hypothetical protein
MWLTPTEEELRARYNPDLRRRSLENQEEKQQEFDDFVGMLKEYSKSDKHSTSTLSIAESTCLPANTISVVWEVAKEADEKRKKAALAVGRAQKAEAEARREEMRREQGLATKS